MDFANSSTSVKTGPVQNGMHEPRLNLPEQTVSELSMALKRTIEESYGYVRVRGELGKGQLSRQWPRVFRSQGRPRLHRRRDLAFHRTAHQAQARSRPRSPRSPDGLTTYPGRSQYQIIVETLEPAGLGALMALLEQRKQLLAAEGLFDEARKQLLPFLPAVIGVITSPSGAVIRDILHRLADRFPRHVLVWPVKVQGDGSATEVAAAIAGFNALPEQRTSALPRRPDLIIVARGGGSLEDLWSFNEEIVVRAAAASLIPLISAVGHETDVTLIDFVADRRAPTPTAAAEMAVPVRAELTLDLDSLARRAFASWRRNQDARQSELRSAARALPAADEVLALPRQRLDQAAARLRRGLRANAQIHHVVYSRIGARLSAQLLRSTVERRRERLGAFAERATRAFRHVIAVRQARAERGAQLLAAFSYRGVLARGFALVRDAAGRPLRTAAAVRAGMGLEIEFADGRVGARAQGSADARAPSAEKPTSEPAKPRSRRDGGPGQGDLF